MRYREVSTTAAPSHTFATTRLAATRSLQPTQARIASCAFEHQRPHLSLLAAAVGALVAAAICVPRGVDAQESAALEEITITGSRIQRRDFTANAPITTIDATTFENTSTIGVETVLNQLPQFVPAITQFTTTDVQQTANNTIGASTVSLRGLGPNRNLVLIDGKRAQPVNPTMVVDTNMIPSSAIQRVEVISGGASAVYGADAVGGVVNFILKDDFEGATVDVRFGDTFDGGNQEVTVSGLIGANTGERGNVMVGFERSTRSEVLLQERDWRIEDNQKPNTPGTAFGWGSDTWISNVQGTFGNLPDQNAVNALFSGNGNLGCTPAAAPGAATPLANCNLTVAGDPRGVGVPQGVPNTVRFLINRPSGTVYSGLMQASGAAGSFRYDGPLNEDNFGRFNGLPFRVVQPDGTIKENNFWQWASTPLERLSSFAKGHFDLSDGVRVTGQALYSRTKAETRLGLTADTITVWGSRIPFGTTLYTGDAARGIPSSLNSDGTTNAAYLPGGRFGLNCEADGQAGCTESEAFPLPPEIVALFSTRPDPEADVWLNRPPDWLREAQQAGRSGETVNNTLQLTLGLEGDFGNHSWDVSASTGRTDTLVTQRGSARLAQWRAMAESPNFGRGFIADPNPFSVGFAESIATCTSGLPVIQDFQVSEDCVLALSPDLKNQTAITQNILEANLVGDLAEMRAGPLSYALGVTRREADFTFEPDNLSLNQNFVDPIAGLFPNAKSGGEFDVNEIYGELLVPIVANGPKGVEHFNLELGGRFSEWSMEEVNTVDSWKALFDWAISPRYRIRGGFNRALRAPNLGELFIERTQIFGGVGSVFGDPCSQNASAGPFSANPAVAGVEQAAQTLAICRALMGGAGAAEYYDNRPISSQPLAGGTGTQNSFGNPSLTEETADTFTLGVAMEFLENWRLTVDYYTIEIEDMIAVEGPDSTYQRCLSIALNPAGDPNAPACRQIFRDPTNGNAANIDLSFTNTGRAKVSGVDLQLDWRKTLGEGGLGLNVVANYNIESETQDSPVLPTRDWAGTQGCALQIQCQGYDYRVFTTVNYFRGPWGVSIRHQYWPEIDGAACVTAPASVGCRFGGVQEDYQLFALSGSYEFNEKYTLRFGIENLLDEEPPLNPGNPEALPFPIAPTHVAGGVGSTYDPLGRRAFVNLTMSF